MEPIDLVLDLINQSETPSQQTISSIIHALSLHRPFSSIQPAQLNKWLNRIHSSLSSNIIHHNLLGATLALITLNQNQHSILHHRDLWILASQNILSRQNLQSAQCFSQVINLLLYLLDLPSRPSPQSTKKDLSASKSISTLVKILIEKSDQSIEDPTIRSLSIKTLSVLLIRYSSILRPFGSQLESIALLNLLNLNQPSISQSATLLLTQLYRLGQKLDQSANWSKTIKATIGSIQIILDSLLSPFLTEFNHPNSNRIDLSPLEIPSQDLIFYSACNDFIKSSAISDNSTQSSPSNRIPVLIARTERLINVLITMLSQSTSKPVSVPLGELSELGSRLILMGKARVHDRADLDWKSHWELLAGTPTCRAMGCRLLTKLAQSTRYRFTPFSSQVISTLSSEIDVNDQNQIDKDSQKACHDNQIERPRVVDGSVIYAAYARIVSSCPANPDTIKTSMPSIIRKILEDIQLIYGPKASVVSSDYTSKYSSKKSKSKRSNDQPNDGLQDWNLQNHSALVNHLDLQLVERALNSLQILLETVPFFFPSSYLTKSIQILLNLSTSPSFISPISRNYSFNSKLDSSLPSSQSIIGSMTNHKNQENLSLNLSFIHRPNLRNKILNCLLHCLPIQKVHSNHQNLIGLNLAQTLLEICSNLINSSTVGDYRRNCKDGELIESARFGISLIVQFISRPRVPVIFLTETQLNAEQDTQSSESENEDQDENDEEEEIRVAGRDEERPGDSLGNLSRNHLIHSKKTKDSKNQPTGESSNKFLQTNPSEPSMNSQSHYMHSPINALNNSNNNSILAISTPSIPSSSNLVKLDHFDEHKKRKFSGQIELPPSKKNIGNQSLDHQVQDEDKEKITKVSRLAGSDSQSDDSDDDQIPKIHFDDDSDLDDDESNEPE